LVLATISPDGLSGKPAAALADAIERTAATLGAPYQTPDELRRAAEQAVAEITARVRIANQQGLMKRVNAEYRAYRQGQIEKREPAVPYSAYIERFTADLVRDVAISAGRMI
jgi:hypothetical protein